MPLHPLVFDWKYQKELVISMWISRIWEKSQLRKMWHKSLFYNDYRRIRRYFRNNNVGVKYLLPGHLWMDYVEVVVTTKCNLRCQDCANLMQYYEDPYHLDRETLLASVRKLGESFDACDHLKILGGEPFLYPYLKDVLEAIPREKLGKITIATNGMVIPTDRELIAMLSRKRVTVFFSNYAVSQVTQQNFIELLENAGISYEIARSSTWIDYGAPALSTSVKEQHDLKRQFLNCHIICKSLLNGCLYYCPRSAHGHDLGIIDRKPGEYVELLNNTTAQNRREIRRLMWRRRPVEACKYCQRGTDKAIKISRGK